MHKDCSIMDTQPQLQRRPARPQILGVLCVCCACAMSHLLRCSVMKLQLSVWFSTRTNTKQHMFHRQRLHQALPPTQARNTHYATTGGASKLPASCCSLLVVLHTCTDNLFTHAMLVHNMAPHSGAPHYTRKSYSTTCSSLNDLCSSLDYMLLPQLRTQQ